MSILMRTLKRAVLALAVVVVAFAWSSTGRAQAVIPCNVERGQDPLDVLNVGVRHNVWITLDASKSMGGRLGGQRKLSIAKDAINQVMDNLVDAAGRPLVNWGLVHYAEQPDFPSGSRPPDCPVPLVPPDANGDNYPDEPEGCFGLEDTAFIEPGTCAQDSRELVRSVLDPLQTQGGTPIGVAFTDIGEYLTGRHRPNDPSVPANRTNFVDSLLPGQKNFVIHITDGLEECECNEGGYPQIPGPLLDPVPMRPSQVDPNVVQFRGRATDPGRARDDFKVYNTGLKGEWALKQIDPALDGSKGNVFVVGFDIQDPILQEQINTIAWMSSGANLLPQRAPELMNSAFFANQPDALEETLRRIVGLIGVPATEIPLGSSVVGSVKEVIHSRTNTSVARQDVMPLDLSDADAIRSARSIRASHRNNVLFSTSVEIPGFMGHLRATNIYRVTNPNSPRTEREADFFQLWDAGELLQNADPDARTIFFNKRGSTTLLPFVPANVDPVTDLGVSAGYLRELDGIGARTDADAATIVVQVVRGYHLSVDPMTRTIYDSSGNLNLSKLDDNGNPTWKLWDSAAGAPAVALNPPRSPDFDPPLNHGTEYGVGGSVQGDGFFWDHFNRQTVVYYAATPGILHGFAGETGAELFAYLPDDVLGLAPSETPGSRDTIAEFVRDVVTESNSVLNHKFMLASPPIVADVFLRSDVGAGAQRGDDDWHTLLAFGRGRGGRFVTALDVTTAPDNPPTLALRWNVGNREGVDDGGLDGLGETWSTPAFGNVDTRGAANPADTRVDQWLVFTGGGYGCDNAAFEGEFLFAFRAEDGEIYYRNNDPVDRDPAAVIEKNGLVASPTVFIPHAEDVADSKDFVTRVYIPDLQGRVHKLDTSDTDPANWTLNVFAEIGPEHPITAPVTLLNDPFTPNRLFVMAGSGGDRRAPEPVGGFKFRTWIDTDGDGQNTTQFLAADAPAFEQMFNPDERMLVPAVTVGMIGDPVAPVVFFAGTSENLDDLVCEITFASTLYAVGVESGLPEFDLDSTQPGTGQASLGDVKVQGLFARDGNVYVSQGGGLGTTGGVGVWGDGSFDDEPAPAAFGQFTLMLLMEGFRISPF